MTKRDETPAERRIRLMSSGGWIGVDLDGTLAEYHGWQPDGGIGTPVRPMLDRVRYWLSEGLDVRIFTARVSEGPVDDGWRDTEGQRRKVQEWCRIHVGKELPVTNVKDYMMIELWDDRAVQVIENTGMRADGCAE